jgi:sugar/nucleoside kinase (ribokinase family)
VITGSIEPARHGTLGGPAVRICLALVTAGLRPILAGTADHSLARDLKQLADRGVDTDFVRDHPVDLDSVLCRAPDLKVVLIAANAPEAMVRLAAQCRAAEVPFAANPADRMGELDPSQARDLIEGARYLFTTGTERRRLSERTGWPAQRIRERIGVWLTSSAGIRIEPPNGAPPITVAALPPAETTVTGHRDERFAAGFLAGRHRYLSFETAAQLGCLLAVTPPAARLDPDAALDAIETTYGAAAARLLAPVLNSAAVSVDPPLPVPRLHQAQGRAAQVVPPQGPTELASPELQ